jgi:hypothetical protein
MKRNAEDPKISSPSKTAAGIWIFVRDAPRPVRSITTKEGNRSARGKALTVSGEKIFREPTISFPAAPRLREYRDLSDGTTAYFSADLISVIFTSKDSVLPASG